MFINLKGDIGPLGFTLALGSGITYGIYIIVLDKSKLLDTMGFYGFTFWFFLLSAAMLTPIAGLAGQLSLPVLPKAWLYIILFALDGGIVATAFLQIGINIIGGRKASILSALEPVTSLVLGVLFFNEAIGITKIVGICLIIASVIVLVIGKPGKT